jgi:hypothetical protein
MANTMETKRCSKFELGPVTYPSTQDGSVWKERLTGGMGVEDRLALSTFFLSSQSNGEAAKSDWPPHSDSQWCQGISGHKLPTSGRKQGLRRDTLCNMIRHQQHWDRSPLQGVMGPQRRDTQMCMSKAIRRASWRKWYLSWIWNRGIHLILTAWQQAGMTDRACVKQSQEWV